MLDAIFFPNLLDLFKVSILNIGLTRLPVSELKNVFEFDFIEKLANAN